jgi:hypothetical protein
MPFSHISSLTKLPTPSPSVLVIRKFLTTFTPKFRLNSDNVLNVASHYIALLAENTYSKLLLINYIWDESRNCAIKVLSVYDDTLSTNIVISLIVPEFQTFEISASIVIHPVIICY